MGPTADFDAGRREEAGSELQRSLARFEVRGPRFSYIDAAAAVCTALGPLIWPASPMRLSNRVDRRTTRHISTPVRQPGLEDWLASWLRRPRRQSFQSSAETLKARCLSHRSLRKFSGAGSALSGEGSKWREPCFSHDPGCGADWPSTCHCLRARGEHLLECCNDCSFGLHAAAAAVAKAALRGDACGTRWIGLR